MEEYRPTVISMWHAPEEMGAVMKALQEASKGARTMGLEISPQTLEKIHKEIPKVRPEERRAQLRGILENKEKH